jgi:hypothetical protein
MKSGGQFIFSYGKITNSYYPKCNTDYSLKKGKVHGFGGSTT